MPKENFTICILSVLSTITWFVKFYKFLFKITDDTAEEFLVRFSLKPYEEIEELLKLHNSQIGKWIAQTHLAEEMTSLVHGQDGLQLAKRCSSILYDGNKNLYL